MGIDWEGILDADGADMADAYDALVFDAYDSEEAWDEEELQNVEDINEDSVELTLYDSDGTPPPFAEADSNEKIPDTVDNMETIQQQRQDIQKLIVILIENDIPIPGDIIDKYIKRTSPVNSEERSEYPGALKFNDEDLPF